MLTNEKTVGVETPYILTSTPNEARSSGVQRKHVLIAVSAVLVAGLIIAGILIGMHIFAQEQKDIVQFSLQFKGSDNSQTNQTVISDPNDNVVIYHISKVGQDVDVVDDFNKDLQIVKVTRSDGTNCYVAPLNRTLAMDPSSITGPDSMTGAGGSAGSQTYLLSNTPIADRSFLTKKAADMCQGVSLYWAYRHCGQSVDGQNMTSPADNSRQKRTVYYAGTYYGLPGLNGCCYSYWACKVTIYETVYSNGVHYCQTYVTTGTCCGSVAYPYCQNWYYARQATPGLVC